VEFGVEIGEYQGVVRVPRRVFQRLLPETPTPERCIEAYYLQRTRFESIAEWKLRRWQLKEDGNLEISGRSPIGARKRSLDFPRRKAGLDPSRSLSFALGRALPAPKQSFRQHRASANRPR
jgi:hypothetical protein